MLEAINNPIKIDAPQTTTSASADLVPPKQVGQSAGPEPVQKSKVEVTQAMLDGLEKDLDNMHEVGLRFSKHSSTGRTMIKVINKETDSLIREIPPEDILNLAAKMQELSGILFDKIA